MAVTLGSNNSALKAQRQLSSAVGTSVSTMQKLSSGQRIVSAADDAAGLAVSMSLHADSRMYTKAIGNLNDGVSLLAVADGALSSLGQITQRQKELAEQAANGVYSFQQRKALDKEANALVREYNRIIESTQFSGTYLFNGSMSSGLTLQAGTSTLTLRLGNELSRVVGDGNFTSAGSLGYGMSGGLTTGDLNGDGIKDIIATDPSVGFARAFLGNGNATFRAPITLTVPNANEAAIGDIDKDGKADVVLTSGNSLYFLKGNGNGTFNASISYAVGPNPREAKLGDFNGDGALDFLSSNTGSNYASVLLGNGDGSFTSARTFFAGNNAEGAATGDFNGDGKLDFVTTNTGPDYAQVFLGNGDGTFRTGSVLTTANNPGNVETGDFDGDGNIDLVTTSDQYVVSINYGNGDGTFKTRVSWSVTGNTAVTVSDVNGDGRDDFVGVTPFSNIAAIMTSTGSSFTPGASLNTGGTWMRTLAMDDFNGDGVTDIASGASFSGGIRIMTGNTRKLATIKTMDLTSQAGARDALNTITATETRISAEKGAIGAMQRRLQTAINGLVVARENFTAAHSRITDADVAHEASTMIKSQIRQQVAAAIASQANQQPALALSLLRG